MKLRLTVAAACIALVSVVLLAAKFHAPTLPVPLSAKVAQGAPTPNAVANAPRADPVSTEPTYPRIGAPEQPAHSMIKPGALVIEELPGTGVDLRGKTVGQVLDELLTASDAGDAASTRRAATLLSKCQERVNYANISRHVPKLGPEVNARFEARFREIAVECGEALRLHGKIWSALMTKAAEAGDRDAQLKLSYYPPEPTDGPEKFAAWRVRSTEFLNALVADGNTEAAEILGYSLATSGEDIEKLKQAIFYFERMRTTATNPVDIEFADKMIVSTRREIDRLESR